MRNRVRTPSASTCLPSIDRIAGSSVIDRIAASETEMITAYVSDFTKPCGSRNRLAADTAINVAENATVRPAVITVRRTAASVS